MKGKKKLLALARANAAEPFKLPTPLRILLADDHALVRRGLLRILAEAFPTAQFGEASTVSETMQLIRSQPWELVVLDINMPGRSGLDVLKEMRQAGIKLPVLMLSVHAEDQYALRALRVGAAGYLCKESAAEQFIAAAQCILSGHTYISPTVAEKLAASFRGAREKTTLERLSDRELEVLRWIGSGKTVKEIAAQLSLSVKTISTYRVRMLAKLNMKTTAELMRFAFEEHLTD